MMGVVSYLWGGGYGFRARFEIDQEGRCKGEEKKDYGEKRPV